MSIVKIMAAAFAVACVMPLAADGGQSAQGLSNAKAPTTLAWGYNQNRNGGGGGGGGSGGGSGGGGSSSGGGSSTDSTSSSGTV